MIPFARMMTYGNVIERKVIKKVIGAINAIGILYASGELYVRGTNQGNRFNTSPESTVINDHWLLMDSDVHDVYMANACSLVIKKDGTVLNRGFRWYSDSGYDSVATDVTTKFAGVDPLSISNLLLSTGILFLTTDGNMYGLGRNSGYVYGNSSIPLQTVPLLLDTEVHVIARPPSYNSNNYYIKGGKLYGNGTNVGSYYAFGMDTTTTIIPYTEIPIPVGYTALDISGSGMRTSLLLREDSTGTIKVFACGKSDGQSLYDRGTANETVYRTFLNTALEYMDGRSISRFGGSYIERCASFIIGADGKVYSSGMGPKGRVGTGYAGSWTYQEVTTLPINSTDIIGITTLGDYYITLVCTDSHIYGSWFNDTLFKELPVGSINAFRELELPK